MTNKERYGDKIIELAANAGVFVLKKWRACTLQRD